MTFRSHTRGVPVMGLAAIWLSVTSLSNAQAAPPRAGELAAPRPVPTQHYQVPLSKSLVIDVRRAFGNVIMADPGIANVVLMRPSHFLIQGKALGAANVLVMGAGQKVMQVLDIEVVQDQDSLKERFHALMPEEKIGVQAAGSDIILSGEVSSLEKMDAAVKIAESFAKAVDAKGKVQNMMHVGGADQVMLEVKVAEIDRTLGRELGVHFAAANTDQKFAFGAIHNNPQDSFSLPLPTKGSTPASLAAAASALAKTGFFGNFIGGDFLTQLSIVAQKNSNLVRILSEPNLTTVSGKKAAFLSGGEFPVPTASNVGGTAAIGTFAGVTFKQFGVGVEFLPVVLDNQRINLQANVEVSDLDNTTAVTLCSGCTPTPGLTTRRAASTLELSDGQTMSIAGLLKDTTREQGSRIPYLGDIPVLGQLFRSQNYQNDKTELVIFVAPHLAKPIKKEEMRLPTDHFVAPDDTEFYLLGRLEGRKAPESSDRLESSGTTGGMVGEYGHTLTEGGAE